MKRLKLRKAKAGREIGCDYGSSLSILLEKIMDEIVEYATMTGLDSYYLLRHYQFTGKEIEEYFDRFGADPM